MNIRVAKLWTTPFAAALVQLLLAQPLQPLKSASSWETHITEAANHTTLVLARLMA